MEDKQSGYLEYTPAPHLQTYIQCYWSYNTDSLIHLSNSNLIIPDGCLDLIFDLSLSIQSSCFIVGAMTRPINNNKNHLFGIRFNPGMATSILYSSVSDITDHIIDISQLKNHSTAKLTDKLLHKKSTRDKVTFLNEIFSKLLPPQPILEKQTLNALNIIKKTGGQCRISEISDKIGWSRQHFTKNFLRHTGLTPKFYSQIIRMEKLIYIYQSKKINNWSQLSQICGYFDQAHMINEFKKITGVTPQIFLKNT